MPDGKSASKGAWLWRTLFIAVGLGLLWAVFSAVDAGEVWRTAVATGWGMVVVLAIYLAAFTIDSVSWLLALTSAPFDLRWIWRTWAVRMVGETFNNIIPAASFGGEPVKAVLLKRHYGVSYHDSTASLILARTINMVGLCVFLAIGFALMLDSPKLDTVYKHTAGIGLAGLATGTLLFFGIQRFRVGSAAGNWLGRRVLSEKVHWVIEQVQRMDETLVRFYSQYRGRFVGAVSLAFANWVLGAVEIYYVLWLLDAPISWAEAWVIEAVAQMVRTGTFFIPLSLGAQEGVFLVVAGAITGQPALGLSVGLVRRFRELLWIAWGYLLGAWYTARQHEDRSG